MRELYRGHEIVVEDDAPDRATIIDLQTGQQLPSRVHALPGEHYSCCLARARRLIDLYLDMLERGALAPAQSLTL